MPRTERRTFKYQERTAEDVQTQMRARGGDYDSYIKEQYKMYKPADGKNLIRILPATWENAKHYAYTIYLNYGIGVDEAAYLSLAKMQNARDPIEEARREAEAAGDKKLAGKLTPKQRRCMWVIDRYHEEDGPLLWAAPWTVDRDIVSLCYDEDTREIILIDHPVKGRDLRFYRQGTGLNTEYNPAKMKVLPNTPLHEDEDREADWLEYITDNPIPECLQFYDYDHINNVFGGRVRNDDEDEDAPARTRGVRGDGGKPASRTRRDPEEEEEPEERPARTTRRRMEPDPDEEPEERPARTARRRSDPDEEPEERPARSRSRLPDPDEEPEEEPEAEPEPAPRRSSLKDRISQRVSRRGAE